MSDKILYNGIDDEQFSNPYIDTDEWRKTPVLHRYIHGGFEGTHSRFCFYFPPEEKYQGRFFQKLSPIQGAETESQNQTGEADFIRFSIEHGAYFVETNLGGEMNGGGDETLMYRCSAQAAQYSRKVAETMYSCERPYGYVFGGSGGGFKTMSCAEMTIDIWDGAVPFVIGSPMSMPNVFTVRAHAMRVLRNKFEQIADAIEPGGSGDPYAVLNEEESAALKEVTLMGFPMDTWCVYDTLGKGALSVLFSVIPAVDPTYFADFWEKDGYLGADKNGSAVRDRIKITAEITEITYTEVESKGMHESIDEENSYGVDEAWKHVFGREGTMPILSLSDYPKGDFYTKGLTMRFLSGELEGQQINLKVLGLNQFTGSADTTGRDMCELMKMIKLGDKVCIDNSDYIAVQTYHRHQVPELEYRAWDQFRNENGEPIYPQRSFLVAPFIAKGGAGGVQEGTPNCKIIILESHMDESAFPWQADWYRHKIMEKSGNDANDIMRLWVMERCMHTDCQEGNGGDHQHIVSYLGILHQALLDISDWVERGIEPSATTGYTMNGGQMILADTASERHGIQPMVSLSANGTARAEVKIGETVEFCAEIALPKGAGELENVEWDFEKTDSFIPCGEIGQTVRNANGTGTVSAFAKHTFERAGTYFPVIKIASNRNKGDRFTRLRNLARVRVVVTE